MKLLILTSLFPPDLGAPAPYVKQLAEKLESHEVTILLYGFLPESVTETTMIVLDKRKAKLGLILSATFRLVKLAKDKDVLIVNNGPSAELPALITSFFTKTPIVLCLSDPLATKASESGLYKFIHGLFIKRVSGVITLPAEESLFINPEKLPFEESSLEIEKNQKIWWENHLKEIQSYA